MTQNSPATESVSRWLPSRPAGISILILCGLLVLSLALFGPYPWMALAYVPLLLAVAMGVFMSGWGLRAMLASFSGTIISAATVGLGVMTADMDRLDLFLNVAMGIMALIGTGLLVVAVYGWWRLFAGRMK